jgi:hypothetical protein
MQKFLQYINIDYANDLLQKRRFFYAILTIITMVLAIPAGLYADNPLDPVAKAQANLNTAQQKLDKLQAALAVAKGDIKTYQSASQAAGNSLVTQKQILNDATSKLVVFKSIFDDKQSIQKKVSDAFDTQNTVLNQARNDLVSAQGAYNTAKSNFDGQSQVVTNAQVDLNIANQSAIAASSAVDKAQSDFLHAKSMTDSAREAQQSAQNAYNDESNYIPDPTASPAYPGLHVDVYNKNSDSWNRTATGNILCTSTILIDELASVWNDGSFLGCGSINILVHFHGYITFPSDTTTNFLGMADDGFYMEIDDQVVINDWYPKGCGGSVSPQVNFKANIPRKIDAWYFQAFGGKCLSLKYYTTANGWRNVSSEVFTQSAPQMIPDPALLAILTSANLMLSSYEAQQSSAQNNVTQANTALSTAQSDSVTKQSAFNNESSKLNTLASIRDSSNQAVQSNNDNVSTQQNALDSINATKAQAQADLDMAQNDLKAQQSNVDTTTGFLNAQQQAQQTADSQLTVAKKTEAELLAQLDQAHQDVNQAQDELAKAQKDAQLVKQKENGPIPINPPNTPPPPPTTPPVAPQPPPNNPQNNQNNSQNNQNNSQDNQNNSQDSQSNPSQDNPGTTTDQNATPQDQGTSTTDTTATTTTDNSSTTVANNTNNFSNNNTPQNNSILPEDRMPPPPKPSAATKAVAKKFDSVIPGAGKAILAVASLGSDMTPRQRKKAQQVVIPAVIVTGIINAVSAAAAAAGASLRRKI